MPDGAPLDPFAILSLLLAAAAGLTAVVVAFRSSSQTRTLGAALSSAVGELQQQLDQADVTKVRGVLEEFETQLVARVQKTERAFVDLGEEVTVALDRAETLRNSASAKESRAKQLNRKREEVQVEQEQQQAQLPYWQDPSLTREQKLQIARDELAHRGG